MTGLHHCDQREHLEACLHLFPDTNKTTLKSESTYAEQPWSYLSVDNLGNDDISVVETSPSPVASLVNNNNNHVKPTSLTENLLLQSTLLTNPSMKIPYNVVN